MNQACLHLNGRSLEITNPLISDFPSSLCNVSVHLKLKTLFVMSVCLSDNNSGTPVLICLKFVLGNSGDPREFFCLVLLF